MIQGLLCRDGVYGIGKEAAAAEYTSVGRRTAGEMVIGHPSDPNGSGGGHTRVPGVYSECIDTARCTVLEMMHEI